VYSSLFPLAPNGRVASRYTRVDTRVILNLIFIKLLHERVHNLVNAFPKEAKIFFMIRSTISFFSPKNESAALIHSNLVPHKYKAKPMYVVAAAITRTQIDRNALANGRNFSSQGKEQLSAVM
jgi:hypothetical protein